MGVSLPDGDLQLGQTATLSLEELIGDYVVGDSYNVVIEAMFSDGTVSSSTVSTMV